MIINRHNYEEFFLLYVDNELSTAERKAVEAFVQEHTDLATELDMLKQATISPIEPIIFEGKNLLFKNEHEINTENCETYFLLDVDNELDANQKAAVERFVLQHPEVQAAFSLLHETRLPIENIEFPGRQSLYKHDERKVVPMRMRMAAAAAFIGIMGLLYAIIPTDKILKISHQPVATVQVPNQKPVNANQAAANETEAVEPTLPMEKVDEEKRSETAKKQVPAATIARSNPVDEPNRQTDSRNVIAPKKLNTKLRAAPVPPINEDEMLVASNRTETANNAVAANIKSKLASNLNPVSVAGYDINPETALVKPTVYKELDTEADYSDNSFLFGSTKLNKNKLRGLLKKATNLFDKKADTDDKEKTIQIASFEIKGK